MWLDEILCGDDRMCGEMIFYVEMIECVEI